MKSRISWTDRLKDRGAIDQWGFALFAGTGSVAIFVAKYFEVEAKWVVIGAIASMLAYALLIARKGSGRLAADQAGDNCYYLGLIYTLTSLSFAIIFFDPADNTSTIVRGFGVALGTTIVGLILRVFFNQGRPDLENFEERARLELTEAASNLTTSLGQAALTMKDFALQLQQSVTEVGNEATRQIELFTKTSIEGLREVVSTADESIRSQANDFSSRSKRYASAFDNLLQKIEAHSGQLGSINEAHETLLASAKATAEASETARDAAAAFSSGAVQTGETLLAISEQSRVGSATAASLASSTEKLQNTVTEFQAAVQAELDSLLRAPGDRVNSASEAITQAAQKLEVQLESLVGSHEAASASIRTQAELALTSAQRHTGAIEEELQKSRSLYSRVFDGLASITDDLARRAEART